MASAIRRKRTVAGIPNVGDVGRLERGGQPRHEDGAALGAAALDERRARPRPPPAAAPSVGDRDEHRDRRAHGVAGQVERVVAERVGDPPQVVGHPRLAVGGGVVRLVRLPVPAGVDPDDLPPGRQEDRDRAGADPVEPGVGDEAVLQVHRRQVPGHPPPVDGDRDAVGPAHPQGGSDRPHAPRSGLSP
jgi:hypothetical protein